MKLDSADVKQELQRKLDTLRRDLAEGYVLLESQTKQVEVLKDQLRRIEGAKLVLEQLLGEIVEREKTAAATAETDDGRHKTLRTG